MMGSGNSKVDCSACFSGQCNVETTPDNDIIGLGVLVSFFASALLTLGAVGYGYLSDSLPQWYINEADASILDGIRDAWLFRMLRSLIVGFEAVSRLRKSVRGRQVVSQDKRVEAVSRFILSLSDQQLVTGLAILISAFTNLRTISIYEFRLVVALAWFSSTTHLATLDVLQQYFRCHKVVRNIRAVGMLAFLGLLLAGLIMSRDPALPNGKEITSLTSEQYGQVLTAPLQCSRNSSSKLPLVLAYLFFYLFTSYATRVGHFFWYQPIHDPTSQNRISYFSHKDCTNINDTHLKNIDKVMKRKGFKRLLRIYMLAARSFYHSFASGIPVVVLSLSYGIAQLARLRANLPSHFSNAATSMSFGQSTALLLLIIPMLTAAEIYFEARSSCLKPNPSDDGSKVDRNVFAVNEMPDQPHRVGVRNDLSERPSVARFAILEKRRKSLLVKTMPTAPGPSKDRNSTTKDLRSTPYPVAERSHEVTHDHEGVETQSRNTTLSGSHRSVSRSVRLDQDPTAPSWDPRSLSLLKKSSFHIFLAWCAGATFCGVFLAITYTPLSTVAILLLSIALGVPAFGLAYDGITVALSLVEKALLPASEQTNREDTSESGPHDGLDQTLQAVVVDYTPASPNQIIEPMSVGKGALVPNQPSAQNAGTSAPYIRMPVYGSGLPMRRSLTE